MIIIILPLIKHASEGWSWIELPEFGFYDNNIIILVMF